MSWATSPVIAEETPDPQPAAWYQEERILYDGIPMQLRFTPPNEKLANEVWNYFQEVDKIFNDYHDNSEVGILNAAGPGIYPVSSSLADAFAGAAHLNRLTDGAFDITVGPLRRLWRAAEKSGQYPTPDDIQRTRASVGPSTWDIVDGQVKKLRTGVKFDFGGVIKGISVDHAMHLLITAGVRAALVQSGGETGCFGLSPRGRTHVLSIPDPNDPQNGDWCTITDPGTGFSGSTSANYHRPIHIGDHVYYHIFDPRTGLPIDLHTLSVSVAFPANGRNGIADGLTKIGAVLGWERLFPLVESLGGDAMILTKEGDRIVEHASAHWSRFIKTPHTASSSP